MMYIYSNVRDCACDTESAKEEWVVSMVEKYLEDVGDNDLVGIAKVDAIYS